MAKKPRDPRPIEQYDHRNRKRVNNPPVGLVSQETDKDERRKGYSYDPHLDPQLIWASKAEHTSFDVQTVSLHVHERIDPRTIIQSVRRRDGQPTRQVSLFEFAGENLPLRQAIEFYKHKHNWSNRLIAGDSLIVMNSLLQKEGMAGQVQMVYIDPPYGIKYSSNFQPFVNKRKVKEGHDEDLTQEPEMIKAFRDTWELGIHSYLSYLRDRLLLARDLLSESGSIFVQISDENVHFVRNLMDEVFGKQNFIMDVFFQCRTTEFTNFIPNLYDHLVWYGRNKEKTKCHQLFYPRPPEMSRKTFTYVELKNGSVRPLTEEESTGVENAPKGSRLFKPAQLSEKTEEIERVKKAGRTAEIGGKLYFKRYSDDFPLVKHSNHWNDTVWSTFAGGKIFVVQTHVTTIARCMLMSTDPGDLVLDPTCGSGTTAYAAELWGRRWVTCDTSRVAIALAKQRLMTSQYDYFELAHPEEGVGSGFVYERVPHVTLTQIANNEPPVLETLYDRPRRSEAIVRVTGPFTVEAVPSPTVVPLSQIKVSAPADASVARSGETLRQTEWKDELLKTGIRGKGGQMLTFSRLEALPGTKWLHAEGETKESKPKRVVVSFGPEHAPLEQRQVEIALGEARKLIPKVQVVAFAAFQFDPEAAKDIDETDWPGVTLLKVQMNADLLTADLKRQRSSNESFWLMGQPDAKVERVKDGKDKGKYRAQVLGFDYYNTRTGVIESGGPERIAMWMLDTDYDGRSVFPRQVFFPMAGENEGWSKLAKSLKGEIDEELIEAYRGTISLPFDPGEFKRVAIKIIDDRGIESLKIIEVA